MVVLVAISEHYMVLFLGGFTVIRDSRIVFNWQPASPDWMVPAFPSFPLTTCRLTVPFVLPFENIPAICYNRLHIT
jgi:hypothetical protein